uniref:hypothetical protein n=1 Tax=Pedobacter schmidteae TaxID=2201271 RepID=UPI000EB5AA07|nr:hypothetical protein [Pedobacter schmidteae]
MNNIFQAEPWGIAAIVLAVVIFFARKEFMHSRRLSTGYYFYSRSYIVSSLIIAALTVLRLLTIALFFFGLFMVIKF